MKLSLGTGARYAFIGLKGVLHCSGPVCSRSLDFAAIGSNWTTAQTIKHKVCRYSVFQKTELTISDSDSNFRHIRKESDPSLTHLILSHLQVAPRLGGRQYLCIGYAVFGGSVSLSSVVTSGSAGVFKPGLARILITAIVLGALVATSVVAVNALQIAGMAFDVQTYEWLHDGRGASLVRNAALACVAGIIAFDLRRLSA